MNILNKLKKEIYSKKNNHKHHINKSAINFFKFNDKNSYLTFNYYNKNKRIKSSNNLLSSLNSNTFPPPNYVNQINLFICQEINKKKKKKKYYPNSSSYAFNESLNNQHIFDNPSSFTNTKELFQNIFNNCLKDPKNIDSYHFKLLDINGEELSKLNTYQNVKKIKLFRNDENTKNEFSNNENNIISSSSESVKKNESSKNSKTSKSSFGIDNSSFSSNSYKTKSENSGGSNTNSNNSNNSNNNNNNNNINKKFKKNYNINDLHNSNNIDNLNKKNLNNQNCEKVFKDFYN